MREHRDVLPVLIYRRGRFYLRGQLREEAAGHTHEVRWISAPLLVANWPPICYLSQGVFNKTPHPFILSKPLRKASLGTCRAC